MPDTPFLLKPREVAKAVRKAMAEGRLGYQTGKTRCKYRYEDGGCCAIGAALPDEIALKGGDSRVAILRELELVDFSADDFNLLDRLQRTHDAIIHSHGSEEKFIAALEACEAA